MRQEWRERFPDPRVSDPDMHHGMKSFKTFKSNRYFLLCRGDIQIQNIDLQLCELYHDVFRYQLGIFCIISYARLVSVVV